MLEFIRVQLLMESLTLTQAKAFIGKWLTEEEYQQLEKEILKNE